MIFYEVNAIDNGMNNNIEEEDEDDPTTYFAMIYINKNSPICNGALISSNWVLTTGECIDNISDIEIIDNITKLIILSDTFVRIITNLPNNNNDTIATSIPHEAYLHPLYNKRTLENNIGLIKLKYPIGIHPYVVDLSGNIEAEENHQGVILSTYNKGMFSTNLFPPCECTRTLVENGNNDIIRKSKSASLMWSNFDATSKHFCALIDSKSANFNDNISIGTPAVTAKDKKLRGLLSWNIFISSSNIKFEYLSFIRISPYIDWIIDIVDTLDSSGSSSLMYIFDVPRQIGIKGPPSFANTQCIKKNWSSGAILKIEGKYLGICFDQRTHDISGVMLDDLKSLSNELDVVS